MFLGIFPLVLVSLSFLCAFTKADTVISCNLKESCILPCRFQASEEEVIHWIQESASAQAHSYYYKQNQLMLQNPRFKGRTSLFLDQLSKGNASLQLKEVEVQDEGRYKCYTSTITGHDQSFVQVNVDAPVHKINIERKDNLIKCSSEGIYPAPKLTWSTEPPSVSLQDTTTIHQSGQDLYDINSSINLSNDNIIVTCTVQTRKNKRKTTLMKLISATTQNTEKETNLDCTLPTAPRTYLVWRFNQSEEILSQVSNEKPVFSNKWEKHFVNLSASGNLKLKDLTSNEGGRYTCEASNSEETLSSDTLLKITETQETSGDNSTTGIIIGVVIAVAAIVVLVVVYVFCLKRKAKTRSETRSKTTSGTDML